MACAFANPESKLWAESRESAWTGRIVDQPARSAMANANRTSSHQSPNKEPAKKSRVSQISTLFGLKTFYGDPEFGEVPMATLLSERYANCRRPLIDMEKASLIVRPGDPYNMKALKEPLAVFPTQGGTTNMCVADRWGNVIAAAPSGLSSTAGVAGQTGIIRGVG